MINIRCGNCKGTHESAGAVRHCYALAAEQPTATVRTLHRPEETVAEQPTAKRAVPATEPQIKYIRDLLEQRESAAIRPFVETGLARGMSKADARKCIGQLRGLPIAQPHTATLAAVKDAAQTTDVPAGRYAVEMDGTLKFYRVDRPTEGRWKGYTFVKVQASDTEYPVKAKASREAVLAAIATNPREAMLRYGREIGACGHCGRTLTNEESRAAGIGPVCAGRMGF